MRIEISRNMNFLDAMFGNVKTNRYRFFKKLNIYTTDANINDSKTLPILLMFLSKYCREEILADNLKRAIAKNNRM